ncbi:MAG TPA: glycosyltransferase family 4 protein [Solirubrobacterales bacterium]|nr:glycosyltransferase family 4 protein [Solirubrobacterales bacterium]
MTPSQLDKQAAEPLRLLVIDEGVLGHRTLKQQLGAALEAMPEVEVRMVTVPAPSRLGRLFLRRLGRLGDGDLHGLRWRLRWSWQARRLLKRNARWADVALIITQASSLLSKGPMRRLPCVLSVDATVGQFTALEYNGPRDRHSDRQQRLIARLERRAIANAAAVMAWTDWNATALREEYGMTETRLETIHPGLDVAWWGEAAAQRPASPEGPMRILFVGNDVERKGLGTLIEAVALLDGAAVLDVVSGDEIPARDFIRVHRGVSANTEELRSLYASADVFALPTRADAVPWAVLEAMAAGLPVVASDVGSIGELLGGSGELVAPGDVDGLAAALRRLEDPERRGELGERARERVGEHYDSAIQAPRLVELLAEVASKPDAVGRLRMRRRTFVALGAGAAGVAVAAPYAVLAVGDEFEQLVASRLGIEPELAAQLLKRAREEYGDTEYDARAAAFALAVRDPVAIVMPDEVRRKAIDGLLEPMLSPPAANLAYAVTGRDPGAPACAGLVHPS